MPKGSWKPPKEALDKVPQNLGRGVPVDKGQGIKWSNGEKGKDVIRMQKSNPSADHPSQRVDYVKIIHNGKVIGRNGQEIKATQSCPKPSETPEAHIPLHEFPNVADILKLIG